MFKCQYSGKISEPYQSPTKLVIEKREKTYEYYNKKTKQKYTTQGWEIVKEISVLPEYVNEVKKKYGLKDA